MPPDGGEGMTNVTIWYNVLPEGRGSEFIAYTSIRSTN